MTTDAHPMLPRNWASAELGRIADVELGKMLDQKRTDGTPLRYLRNINVRWDSIDTSDLLCMPFKAGELERYALIPGDVLVCEGGEPGRCAVWSIDDPTIKYQKALHRVRMSGGIQPRWLVFHLYFDAQRGALLRHLTGTTIKHFPREAIREYVIRVAPLEEQYRIVEAIESYFTRLDDAVTTLKRVQCNLERYRASVLKAAVEGRLVPTEAELARAEGRDYETASVLLQRIFAERRRRWEEAELAKMNAKGKVPKDDKWKAKYKEPVGPDTTALPGLPDGWSWATVESISSKVVDGVHKKPVYVDDGVPFVTVRNLTAGPGICFENLHYITEADHEQFIARTHPEPGDLLVSKDGTLGVVRAIRTDKVFSIFVSVALVKPILKQMTDYLEVALSSPVMQNQMVPKGSGLQHIHLEDLRADCIPVPPVAEWARISAEVQRHHSMIDEIERGIRQNLARCLRLRQSILKWAFEGRLVDQDPGDEPASVLLDRIKTDREAKLAQSSRSQRSASGMVNVRR